MNLIASSETVLAGEVSINLVTRRLRAIGVDPRLFRPEALDLLVAYGGGSVRQLDALLRLTLFLASTENASSVSAELVEKAASTTSQTFGTEDVRAALEVEWTLKPSPRDRLIPPSADEPRSEFTRARVMGAHIASIIVLGILLSPSRTFDVRLPKPRQMPTALVAPLPENTPEKAVRAVQMELRSDTSGLPSAGNSTAKVAPTGPTVRVAAPFPRVIIDFAGADRFSEYQAAILGTSLRAIGFHVIAVVRKRSVPMQSVRYYYPGDEDFARHVAQALGQDWRNRVMLMPEAGEAVYPGLIRVMIREN